jgi:hypothetical protein
MIGEIADYQGTIAKLPMHAGVVGFGALCGREQWEPGHPF